MFYGYDPTVIFIIPALLLALFAEYKVSSNFKRYSKVQNKQGYTGADVAKQLLMIAGIHDVDVRQVRGNLTDNYNPQNKTLNLSDKVYGSTSLAAIGVAAHETGHAIQHKQAYAPLTLRSSIVPVVNFSSKLSMPLIFLGLVFARSSTFLLNFGILLFAVVVFFQIVTLPVEIDASNRAVKLLSENNFLSSSEIPAVKKVLGAAALTYVASAVYSIMTLLRYIMIANSRRN